MKIINISFLILLTAFTTQTVHAAAAHVKSPKGSEANNKSNDHAKRVAAARARVAAASPAKPEPKIVVDLVDIVLGIQYKSRKFNSSDSIDILKAWVQEQAGVADVNQLVIEAARSADLETTAGMRKITTEETVGQIIGQPDRKYYRLLGFSKKPASAPTQPPTPAPAQSAATTAALAAATIAPAPVPAPAAKPVAPAPSPVNTANTQKTNGTAIHSASAIAAADTTSPPAAPAAATATSTTPATPRRPATLTRQSSAAGTLNERLQKLKILAGAPDTTASSVSVKATPSNKLQN